MRGQRLVIMDVSCERLFILHAFASPRLITQLQALQESTRHTLATCGTAFAHRPALCKTCVRMISMFFVCDESENRVNLVDAFSDFQVFKLMLSRCRAMCS